VLAVVDTFSRFSPVLDARLSYRGEDVVETLDRVTLDFSRPGKPTDGIDAIAFATLEVLAPYVVLGLEMADQRLDGGASFHRALTAVTRRAWPENPDPELLRVVMATIALVDMDAAGLHTGRLL
jgi:hypothetical protein